MKKLTSVDDLFEIKSFQTRAQKTESQLCFLKYKITDEETKSLSFSFFHLLAIIIAMLPCPTVVMRTSFFLF